MRHHTPAQQAPRQPLAAILIDYGNLHQHLTDRLNRSSHAEELIAELLDALRRALQDQYPVQIAVTRAYADFGAFEESAAAIQRTLCLQDAEPRFVPCAVQANAAELQLCVEATELILQRPDVEYVVLVTGDRAYLPVVQQARRYGRRPLVFALAAPAVGAPYQAAFADAAALLGEASHRALLASAPAPYNGAGARPAAEPAFSSPAVEIEDPVLLRTLAIIEEYFGQYEEVYLTPLLRKLSELLDERQNDPKTLISELEKAGAVRLEKRRGFPYDYTVLIVEADHPNVERLRQTAYDDGDDGDRAASRRSYDDDYDAGYDEDEDDYDRYADDYESDAVAEAAGDLADLEDYDESERDEELR